MRKYEIALLFDAGLEKKKLEKVLKDFEGFVKKSKGQIIEKEQWKERELAYPIKKATSGIYFFAHYELETDKNGALLKDLNLNQDILRYLITLPPKGIKLEGESKRVGKKKAAYKKKAKVEKEVGGKIEEPGKEKPTRVEEKVEEVKGKKEVEEKERSLPAGRQVSTPLSSTESLEMTDKKDKPKDKKEERPRVKKTVEESKKAKAREQKEKKVSEEKLDQEIDRILSDEDLL